MSLAAATNEGGATSKGRSEQDIRGRVTAGLRRKNDDRNLLLLTVATPRDPLANERVNLAKKYAGIVRRRSGSPSREENSLQIDTRRASQSMQLLQGTGPGRSDAPDRHGQLGADLSVAWRRIGAEHLEQAT
jgi:hypothetical protein